MVDHITDYGAFAYELNYEFEAQRYQWSTIIIVIRESMTAYDFCA